MTLRNVRNILTAALLGLLVLAPRPAQANCDPFKEEDADKTIKQGEFAVLLAQALDVKRMDEDKWSCSKAIDELKGSDPKIEPEDGGWNSDKDLHEGVMVELVRRIGLQLSTAAPGKDVKWATAKTVIAQIARLMVTSDGKLLRMRATVFETGRPMPLASPTEP